MLGCHLVALIELQPFVKLKSTNFKQNKIKIFWKKKKKQRKKNNNLVVLGKCAQPLSNTLLNLDLVILFHFSLQKSLHVHQMVRGSQVHSLHVVLLVYR